MKNIIREVILKRKITLLFLLILIFFGVYNYIFSPREETPQIVSPVALITAVYPGASPQDIENLVTSEIEDEIAKMKEYDYSYSFSRDSISVVAVRIKYGSNLEVSWDDLKERMDDLSSKLPSGCQKINVNTDLISTASVIISMGSDTYSYDELEYYAKELSEDLIKIEGVSKFDIVGTQEEELVIDIDYKKLNKFNLSYNDLVNLIKSQNIEIPSGKLGEKNNKINVKVKGLFSSKKDIENIIIAGSKENGSVAKLKDIATVTFKLDRKNTNIITNSHKAILLAGYFKEDQNAVIIGKKVDKLIERYEEKLPEGIIFEKILDNPKSIDKSVKEFAMNLLEGIIFVVLVVFIGMGIRNAVIVSTAIPSSILTTFILMKIFHINIHQISIAALIVALGMLVDNAIVVSDAIQSRIDSDEDMLGACVNGVAEVLVPVFTSTLTTIVAFLPLLMLNSVAGDYIKSLPQIVMISLSISYLVAIFITPTMAFIFFRKRNVKTKKARFRLLFEKFLKFSLNHKSFSFIIIIIVLSVTACLGINTELKFFPYADTDMFYLDIKNENANNKEGTEELVHDVISFIEKEKYINDFSVAIGDGLPRFYNSIPLPAPSDDYAQMMLKFNKAAVVKEFTTLEYYLEDLQNRLDREVLGGKVSVKQLEQSEPIEARVIIRVSGNDLRYIKEYSEDIVKKLKSIEGTKNVRTDFDDYNYEFYVDVDDVSNYYGLSKYDIQNEISIALYGRSCGEFKKDSKEYNIKLISDIKNVDDLKNLGIKSYFIDRKILLRDVSDIKLEAALPVVKKYDRDLNITIYSDVYYGYYPVEIQNTLREMLIEDNNVTVTFDGERERIIENFGKVGESAIIAIVLVFLILLVQFHSYKQTFIILFTIPLSSFGSLVGLYVTGQKLSFTAILGIVSLMGIVVNNAIVLVDYINGEKKLNKTIYDSCNDAVAKRFRPIMLSTITTIIGLIPLVLSGSELFMPMAISLMSGLLVSTLFTLIIIPTLYYIFIRE